MPQMQKDHPLKVEVRDLPQVDPTVEHPTVVRQGRQGDFLFTHVPELPRQAKHLDGGTIILNREGEHKHIVMGGQLYEAGGRRYLELNAPTLITHAEHAPMQLDKGVWEVNQAQRYIPAVPPPPPPPRAQPRVAPIIEPAFEDETLSQPAQRLPAFD